MSDGTTLWDEQNANEERKRRKAFEKDGWQEVTMSKEDQDIMNRYQRGSIDGRYRSLVNQSEGSGDSARSLSKYEKYKLYQKAASGAQKDLEYIKKLDTDAAERGKLKAHKQFESERQADIQKKLKNRSANATRENTLLSAFKDLYTKSFGKGSNFKEAAKKTSKMDTLLGRK